MANQRAPITVRLDHFEGPLDLLLYLIQSHELDISTVSISKITDQYLTTITLMRELNFDLASEFLVMAATLLYWKSKWLLPKDETASANGEDEFDAPLSQEELVRQLLEHQRFLAAGEDLAGLPKLHEDVFIRTNSRPPALRKWRQMDLSDLVLSYQDSLSTARKRKQILKKETVSISTKILEFAEKLHPGKLSEIRSLMDANPTRPEYVVTFLASLELSKLKKLKLYQEDVYRPIYLELIETLKGFDLKLVLNEFKGVDDDEPKKAEIENQVQ